MTDEQRQRVWDIEAGARLRYAKAVAFDFYRRRANRIIDAQYKGTSGGMVIDPPTKQDILVIEQAITSRMEYERETICEELEAQFGASANAMIAYIRSVRPPSREDNPQAWELEIQIKDDGSIGDAKWRRKSAYVENSSTEYAVAGDPDEQHPDSVHPMRDEGASGGTATGPLQRDPGGASSTGASGSASDHQGED